MSRGSGVQVKYRKGWLGWDGMQTPNYGAHGPASRNWCCGNEGVVRAETYLPGLGKESPA